jgi:serine/threonine protein kinase/tetratricopeptide (TPR) repeat protein
MSKQLPPRSLPETWNLRIPASGPLAEERQQPDRLIEEAQHREEDHASSANDDPKPRPTDSESKLNGTSRLFARIFQRRRRGNVPAQDENGPGASDRTSALDEVIGRHGLIRLFDAKGRNHEAWPRIPQAGEELFGFRLREPLGHGAFARVYLAEQPDLASRPVVLKISAIAGTEPQTLARLQHTNIVPIFSVHDDRRTGLRAVCMPYFGGASLSCILGQLWSQTDRPTWGNQLVGALEAVSSPAPETLSTGTSRDVGLKHADPGPSTESQTPLGLLRGMSYPKAVAWVVAQLADGLHHAHQRGILHRDVKPSNILLSSEGQPFLLDFNVAQELQSDPAQAMLGGTVAYSAPEHLHALMDCTPEMIRQVDRRSDLYSLGLVLAEMLTGECIFEQAGSYSAQTTQLEAMAVERGKRPPSLRLVRRDIPWSLESISRKCLDPDPQRRYQQGDHLAEDLRRFLEERPLAYAPELSRLERVRKFFRRNPRLRTAGTVTAAALTVLIIVGSALVGARVHLEEARTRLVEAQARERKRAHDAGTLRALCLVNTTLGRENHLREGIAVCEQTLALYQIQRGQSGDEYPDWRSLAREERQQVAEDRRELMLLLAGARVRLAKGDRATLHGALALLGEAEALPGLGASKALWMDRASYWSQLGEKEKAQKAQTTAAMLRAESAREHYLLAISYSRRGGDGYRRAIAELNETLHLQPRHYWSSLQRGICHMELGEYAQAIGDFGTCVGLWPEHPWGYFNRGYVLDRMGMKADAIADYTAALERDDRFVAAFVNRGLAHVELKEYRKALADFDQALRLDPQGDAPTQAGRGIALEALGRHAEADSAFRVAFALAPQPDAVHIRLNWTYGFAVASRLPQKAEEAFDDVLRHEPQHPQALYGQAMLAMDRGRLDAALGFFDRALEATPAFVEARRYRAVVLARQGKWDRAARDINWCLDREPRSGDTLYAAACVAARAAEVSPTPDALDRAFELLQRAIAQGSGKKAIEDPDLFALRRDPRFGQLLGTTVQTDIGAGSGSSTPDSRQR